MKSSVPTKLRIFVAFVDEDQLIAVGVLVKVIHFLGLGRRQRHGDVAVEQERLSRFQVVVLRFHLKAGEPHATQAFTATFGVTSVERMISFTCVGRCVW